MNILKRDKKSIAIIMLLQLAIGIYIALIRMDFYEQQQFDVMFFYAREGLYIDLTNREFDFQVIMSILDLLITIPLLSSILSKNYLAKRCYIATRIGSYGKLFFKESISILGLCFSCGVIYSTGIAIVSFFASDKSLYDKSSIGLIMLSLFTYTIISFTMVLIGSIISVLFNEKTGIVAISAIFLIYAVTLFFLPAKFKQWNMLSWYFIGVFTMEKEYILYSPYVYYSIAALLNILIYFIGYNALKKKDVL